MRQWAEVTVAIVTQSGWHPPACRPNSFTIRGLLREPVTAFLAQCLLGFGRLI